MTAATLVDPFVASHEAIAEQLEPFCDDDLQRFTDHELLDAYDLAVTWTDELPTAEVAQLRIAAEWLERHRRHLPRFGSAAASPQLPDLAAQFDRVLADLDATS